MSKRPLAIARALAVATALAGCGKEKPSGPAPELTGLATVPATAAVVMVIDVAKMAQSPLLDRAAAELMARDPTLAGEWQKVREGCKIDVVKQVKFMTLVLGPTPPTKHVGEGPMLLVATGNLPEHDLAECVGKIVGKGTGSITGKTVEGRTVYQVKDGAHVMHFAFGRPDTVVMSSNEPYLQEALGAGKKLPDQPELAGWMKLTDRNAPVWLVGRLDERVKQKLVGVTDNAIKAGASGFVAAFDLSSGAKVDVGVVMDSPADAKTMESWTKSQKAAMEAAVQGKALATVFHKFSISADNRLLRLHADLNMDDVNRLLNALDPSPASAQSPTPPASAGSGSAAAP